MNSSRVIRKTTIKDIEPILAIEKAAFQSDEEAGLVVDLLQDPSAEPILSLLLLELNEPVGHIIFSRAEFEPQLDLKAWILGPLAVIPTRQKSGIGSLLVEKGISILKDKGADWVFVLGHESYYPRFGFSPALPQGFEPPYPIPSEFTNAWMARALTPTCIAPYQGKVIPADSFNHPRYWSE
jgi:putative acetyltransferase